MPIEKFVTTGLSDKIQAAVSANSLQRFSVNVFLKNYSQEGITNIQAQLGRDATVRTGGPAQLLGGFVVDAPAADLLKISDDDDVQSLTENVPLKRPLRRRTQSQHR